MVRSGFGAALYEHESVKIVALVRNKYSSFASEPSAFVPVVGLWLDPSLYLPMAIGFVKMVALRAAPNAHQLGKNDRAGQKKFRPGKIYIPGPAFFESAPTRYGHIGNSPAWQGFVARFADRDST